MYKVDTTQKDHISHTKQYQFHQAIFGKIKCDELNFRGVQNGYHQHF